MMMTPRVYQPDTLPREKAGDWFTPPAEAVAKMMKFNEELAKAGALNAHDGLHPSSKGARVVFSGGKLKVTDGPFTEAKEVIGGYWMIEAKSKEEAVEWARRCPASDGDVIESLGYFDEKKWVGLSKAGYAVEPYSYGSPAWRRATAIRSLSFWFCGILLV